MIRPAKLFHSGQMKNQAALTRKPSLRIDKVAEISEGTGKRLGQLSYEHERPSGIPAYEATRKKARTSTNATGNRREDSDGVSWLKKSD